MKTIKLLSEEGEVLKVKAVVDPFAVNVFTIKELLPESSHATPEPVDVSTCPSEPCAPDILMFDGLIVVPSMLAALLIVKFGYVPLTVVPPEPVSATV